MTNLRHILVLIITFNYIITCHLVRAACDANAIHIDSWIIRGRALEGAVFWRGTLRDITKCAVACIRRKVCKSFNYDLVSHVCELNVAVEGERPFRRATNGQIYSEIVHWLSQFDPSCSSRPCTVNEVCLPGQLATPQPGEGECSYFCMDSSMLCPKPYPSFYGSRKVGAVNTVTCGRGEVGGDSAECLVTLEWSKVVNTQCALVYEHACTASDTFCLEIAGVCTDGTCQCPGGLTYDSADKLCILACGVLGSYANAVLDPTETGTTRTFECDDKYVPLVPEITCEVDDVTQAGAWEPAVDICTAVYQHACTLDTLCLPIDGVCRAGTCQCPDGHSYDAVAMLCTFACDDPPIGYANVASYAGTGAQRTFECDVKYEADATVINCEEDAAVVPPVWAWTPTTPICTAVYQHACTSHTICLQIDGVCTAAGTCQCPDGHSYDTVTMMCTFACVDPPIGYANVASYAGTGAQRTFVCDFKYVELVANINCEVVSPSTTGTWRPLDICTDMYLSECTADGDCSDIGGICDNSKCNCASNKVFDTATKLCSSKFRLQIGTGGDSGATGDGVTSGHLMTYHDGGWSHVCRDDWNWQATNVICRELNSTYVYGGVHHHSEAYGDGSDDVTWKFDNIECPDDATSFTECTYNQIQNCDAADKAVGITCYQADITNAIRLNYTYQDTSGSGEIRLEVFYDEQWGTVCEHDWGGDNADTACLTMFPNRPKKDQECKDSCAGGPDGPYLVRGVKCDGSETHFFYCRNDGWNMGYSCQDKEVGLLCKA